MSKRYQRKEFTEENIKNVGEESGAYALIDSSGDIHYVNKSSNLQKQLLLHKKRNDFPETHKFQAYETGSNKSASAMERKLFWKNLPFHNDNSVE